MLAITINVNIGGLNLVEKIGGIIIADDEKVWFDDIGGQIAIESQNQTS